VYIPSSSGTRNIVHFTYEKPACFPALNRRGDSSTAAELLFDLGFGARRQPARYSRAQSADSRVRFGLLDHADGG